jgi:peptide/nickel transport system permease protein
MTYLRPQQPSGREIDVIAAHASAIAGSQEQRGGTAAPGGPRDPGSGTGVPTAHDMAADDGETPSILKQALRTPTVLIGGGLLVVFLLIAIVAPLIAPYPPTEFHTARSLEGPSGDFLLGTDQFGRDTLSRVLIGTRSIFLVSFSATAFGVILGTVIGLTAGYYGGKTDEILMRIADGVMSFPSLLLALFVLTMFGPALVNVIIAIGLVFVPRVARIIRSVALDIRTNQFIQAAEARGERSVYIILREMLPNAWPPVVVESSIRVSYAILISASLGFLGLGVQEPTPDWGLMISQGRNMISVAPWLTLAPAVAISTLVIATNVFADGLSRILLAGGRVEGANE